VYPGTHIFSFALHGFFASEYFQITFLSSKWQQQSPKILCSSPQAWAATSQAMWQINLWKQDIEFEQPPETCQKLKA
jgi:hypothetical protein